MKEMAWIGSERDFHREFRTCNGAWSHRGEFYDKENNTIYYCIETTTNAMGRRFDEVTQGIWGERYDYYNAIYQRVIHTRMKKGISLKQ